MQRRKLPPVAIRKLAIPSTFSKYPDCVFKDIRDKVFTSKLKDSDICALGELPSGFTLFVIYWKRKVVNEFVEATKSFFPHMVEEDSDGDTSEDDKDVVDEDDKDENDDDDDYYHYLPSESIDQRTDVMMVFIGSSDTTTDVFLASSGYASHKIRKKYWDTDFQNTVAKRILEFKIKDITTHNLTGAKCTEAVSYRPGHEGQPIQWSFLGCIKVSYTMPLLYDSPLYQLECFQTKTGSPRKINVVIGDNYLKFKLNLHIESLGNVLQQISEILKPNTSFISDARFSVFDDIKVIRDKPLLKQLDGALITQMVSRKSCSNLHLSYNDYVKWNEPEMIQSYIKIPRGKEIPLESSLLQDVLSVVYQEGFEYLVMANKLYIEFKYNQRRISKPLVKLVEGHLIHNGKSVFKHGGKWLEISSNYIQELDNQFSFIMSDTIVWPKILPLPWIYSRKDQVPEKLLTDEFERWVSGYTSRSRNPENVQTILELFRCAHRRQTEGDYNEGYILFDQLVQKESSGWGYLLGDRILVKNVELFDIMYYTPDTTYLIHVKEGFGQSIRDVCSQIRVSAELLFRELVTNRGKFLLQEFWDTVVNCDRDGYRQRVKDMYENLGETMFQNLFHFNEIVYVLAYRDTRKIPSKESASTLAKMEIVKLFKDFKEKYVTHHIEFKIGICSISKWDPGWLEG